MWNASTKSKIYHLHDSFSFIQQNVFQLHITMCHVPLMTVVNSLHNLSPKELRLKLWHLSIWFHFEVSVETPTVDIFHDDEHLLV